MISRKAVVLIQFCFIPLNLPAFFLKGSSMRIKKKIIWVLMLFILGSIVIFEQNLKSDKIVVAPNSSYNASFFSKGTYEMRQKPFNVLLQYFLPQHALSYVAGWLAENQQPWLKDYLIRYFLHCYTVNMQEAIIEDPFSYPSFNSFFTRHLKPTARPISSELNAITSPADGFISQIGEIHQNTLMQAKGVNFDLVHLLGGELEQARLFADGSFATFYLSPKDYHRVHMPLAGKLTHTLFIPGKLFSVNQSTAAHVPQLFARNERLVCIFETSIGPMAVILVGAMLVGSIETAWHTNTHATHITRESFDNGVMLQKGEELGYFKMGSTVIVLFGHNKIKWNAALTENTVVRMGEQVGTII